MYSRALTQPALSLLSAQAQHLHQAHVQHQAQVAAQRLAEEEAAARRREEEVT
jgi:hypothetical protein